MPSERGITRGEIMLVAACAGLVLALFALILAQGRRVSQELRGGVNVAGVTRALINWTSDNKGNFPTPSLLDPDNQTVADAGSAKNTTANILSILIWNQSVTPELLVDAHDPNPIIAADADYVYKNPPKAVSGDFAAWDPAFSADFTGATPGNVSYTHRRPMDWRTWTPRTPLVSSRGAAMIVPRAGDPPVFTNRPSLHLRNGGWEGNVAYEDTSVEFLRTPFVSSGAIATTDAIFHDESAGQDPRDVFLGIFTTAGDAASDFTPIWD